MESGARHASPIASARGLISAVRTFLPTGGLLPTREWERRHRLLVALLWLLVVALPAAGALVDGYQTAHTVEHLLALAPFAVAASIPRLGPRPRSTAVALGLLTAAALAVHLTGGMIEAHFAFFVLVVALTLYEDWLIFLLAVGYVLVHHGAMGTLAPEAVYNHAGAIAHPWLWAGVHALFVALAGTAGVLAWRLNENVREEMQQAHEDLLTLAVTDTLTGLPNRRKMVADLERSFQPGAGASVLLFLDLDGFKSYNDRFGHPAGDALLARLGGRLAEMVAGRATAYRLGGDEFCLLGSGSARERVALEELAATALSEKGEAFSVSVSIGSAMIPAESGTPSDAMALADRRMYSSKESSRASATNQSKQVLLRALTARHPELESHFEQIGNLVGPVAAKLGVSEAEAFAIRSAAELHDIGKVAIPDAILAKPGPLSEAEWDFVRKHTLIGQRIVEAAPALNDVGGLIRSSHERWDGAGYPDGLAGEEIPIGARIVSVVDAYDAMTSDRPYQRPISRAEALAELKRCAGSQFDPAVVNAFCEVMVESAARSVFEGAPAGVAAPGPFAAV